MPSSQPRSPHDFVRFARPPVTEVALTAQFAEPAVDLRTVGAFAEKIGRGFPSQTQQPPAPVIEPETFNQVLSAPPFRIQLQPQAPLPRIWFESKNQEQLIQLQADRLSVNWRSLDGDPTRYPRYSKLREVFKAQFKRLATIVEQRGQSLPVSACEVLYVNPVEPRGEAKAGTHPDLATVLNRLRRSPKGAFLGQPEDSQLQARWRIPGQDDRPAGRLYLSATPALSDAQRPIYLVQMIGRTIPARPKLKGVMDALDLGHEWVVRGFADVTTSAMHQIWERED